MGTIRIDTGTLTKIVDSLSAQETNELRSKGADLYEKDGPKLMRSKSSRAAHKQNAYNLLQDRLKNEYGFSDDLTSRLMKNVFAGGHEPKFDDTNLKITVGGARKLKTLADTMKQLLLTGSSDEVVVLTGDEKIFFKKYLQDEIQALPKYDENNKEKWGRIARFVCLTSLSAPGALFTKGDLTGMSPDALGSLAAAVTAEIKTAPTDEAKQTAFSRLAALNAALQTDPANPLPVWTHLSGPQQTDVKNYLLGTTFSEDALNALSPEAKTLFVGVCVGEINTAAKSDEKLAAFARLAVLNDELQKTSTDPLPIWSHLNSPQQTDVKNYLLGTTFSEDALNALTLEAKTMLASVYTQEIISTATPSKEKQKAFSRLAEFNSALLSSGSDNKASSFLTAGQRNELSTFCRQEMDLLPPYGSTATPKQKTAWKNFALLVCPTSFKGRKDLLFSRKEMTLTPLKCRASLAEALADELKAASTDKTKGFACARLIALNRCIGPMTEQVVFHPAGGWTPKPRSVSGEQFLIPPSETAKMDNFIKELLLKKEFTDAKTAWGSMKDEKKEDVLKIIITEYCKAFGYDKESPSFAIEVLNGCAGVYSPTSNEVKLNSGSLNETFKSIVNDLVHELTHWYQECVDKDITITEGDERYAQKQLFAVGNAMYFDYDEDRAGKITQGSLIKKYHFDEYLRTIGVKVEQDQEKRYASAYSKQPLDSHAESSGRYAATKLFP